MIPKKRRADELESMRNDLDTITKDERNARKRRHSHGSSSSEYWAAAIEVAELSTRKERTNEARGLFERMRVQERRVVSYSKHRDLLSLSQPRRSLREYFIRLWTANQTGLSIRVAGTAGPRDPSFQSNLDEFGNVWCPVLGKYFAPDMVTASHLFPWRPGQDGMDAMFGRIRPSELFPSRNGMMIATVIEKQLGKGVLAIVPDLPERPTKTMLSCWAEREIRDYKIRLIDPEWAGRNHFIDGNMMFKDLDGKKLVFKGNFRPAARYLYYHYCAQIIHRSWRKPSVEATPLLEEELGKPFWGTPGPYIRANMLRAVMEEVGHDAGDLLIGAKRSGGKDSLVIDVIAEEVAARQAKEERADEGENEEENEDEDDNEDEDEYEGGSSSMWDD
ncbi:hypothetical protein BJX64DRAFT_281870 [Aspergillus heterothallicus]